MQRWMTGMLVAGCFLMLPAGGGVLAGQDTDASDLEKDVISSETAVLEFKPVRFEV